MEKFDIVILGAGPGGYVAAIRAAQLGFKTALVEKEKTLGGTCLNIGCIPSKALLNSSEHFHFIREEAEGHGIGVGDVKLNLAKMLSRKDQVVKQLTGGIDFLMKKNKVTVFQGLGTVPSRARVLVEPPDTDPIELEAAHIIIATGSVSADLPNIEIDETTVVTSTEALSFEEVPKELIVIGAGAIGLELGSVWSRLGSKVTILEFLPRIAPGFDLEVAKALQRTLTAQGLEFHLETRVSGVTVEKNRATVTAAAPKGEITLEGEKVLVAVGRRAFGQGVVTEDLGLAIDGRGRITVDGHYRTNVPGIYAIGDVIAGPMLAHKAEEEGIACVERIAGKAGHVNYDAIPGIVYTSPEAAAVGLTEEAAKEKGLKYKVGKFYFKANGRALAAGDSDGMVKLISEEKTDRLLGAHILHAEASELIAECVSVLEFGGTAEDIARTSHGHPTLSEAVKEAALAVEKRAIHGG